MRIAYSRAQRLTRRQKILEHLLDIDSFSVLNRLEFTAIVDVDIWIEIMRRETYVDLQALVAEYFLIFAENGVGELRGKGGKTANATWVGLDQMEVDYVVGIRYPY